MSPVTRTILALALLGVAPAWAQSGASDRVEGPVPEEVDSFRAARERFHSRIQEIDEDTRSYVGLREAEERSKLSGGFDSLIDTLEQDEKQRRELAIQRFESFLDRYPHAAYASHIRFRLADLYFERSSERWQAESADYFAKVDDPNLPIEELEALGDPPRRDLQQALALYLKIVEDNRNLPAAERYERLDGTFVMMGFVYNDPNNVQYDPEKAKQAFADLIVTVPGSELADRSHLFLGNFLFADNEFDAAIAQYESVYNKGEESKYYLEGLYQLAWARYKLNEFDESLRLFTELLDKSEELKTKSSRESSFAPDAKRFMAFSFADLGYDQDRESHLIAQDYFAKVGERPYERKVLAELADVLIRYTRPEEAIETYALLQDDERWRLEPDNPAHQIARIGLYQTSVARDLEAAGRERLEFIERYSEGSEWWDANRNDPEALDVARGYIEGSLLDVAIEYRVRAQESGQQADFALAAEKYREYLDKFPISDDYYEQQWYLADSLKLAGRYDDALAEFDSLFRSKRYHPYGDAALYSTMDVQLQRMLALGHAPDELPTESPVARSYEANGNKIDVYELTPDRRGFMDAADAVVAHKFGPSLDEDLPDYQQEVEAKRPSLLYLSGQVMYYHNDYEDARKRFFDLIDRYRYSVEANYAAGLIVDSFIAEGDLQNTRKYAMIYTANPPGPPDDIDPSRFGDTLEGTTFKLARDQGEAGDHLGAAEAFVTFRKEFADSQFGMDALYNAAFYYQQAGKVEKSNALYEQYVAEYPKDKRSKGLFLRIASNYESAFELGKAEDYYLKFLAHPEATETEKADAQFNRSFLLIGLGRYREAAEGFEEYERRYPNQADREEIYWLAGEQWQEVSKQDAIQFYERYLRKYPDENPDHVIEAEYQLLRLYSETGADDRRIRRQNEAILSAFDRFARAGKQIGANGHKYAAAADYPRIEKLFADYSKDALSGNEEKDGNLLQDKKPAELKAFEAEAKAFIAKYQNFEYNSGALLLQARAALYLADLGLSLECPKALSEEDCWLFEDVLQERVFPQYYEIEEVGIRRLTELVQAAKDRKRHSRFIDDALIELNRRRPGDFPAVKRELEGGTDSSIKVVPLPLRLDAPQPEPEPAPTPEPEPQPAPPEGEQP